MSNAFSTVVIGLLLIYFLGNYVIFYFGGIAATILGPLIAVIGFIGNIIMIFVDPRETTPQSALQQYIKRILIGDDSFNLNNKNPYYSYEVLDRIVPAYIMPRQKIILEYLNDFRGKLHNILNSDFIGGFDDEFDGKTSSVMDASIISEEEISPGIKRLKLNYCLTFSASRPTSGGGYKVINFSRVEMAFDVILAQSEGRWYMYDPIPEYIEAE